MITLAAAAKINLYLHITGRRANGYHELDTVFQLIDMHDTVRLQTRNDGLIVLHTPILGLDDAQHLAVRAALLLQAHTQCPTGADIWVDKQIPSGAGLGGGSSDAASTLIGLNRLWQCGLSVIQLQSLGLQLGADVPFFCSQLGTARALGIGEQLQAVPTREQAYLVVFPNCHVPTPAVFKHPDLNWQAAHSHRLRASTSKARALQACDDYFSPAFNNDLQAVAQRIAPPIAQAIDQLKTLDHALCVRMSGSGSAVFAVFENIDTAQAARSQLNALQTKVTPPWSAWACAGLNQHPALGV